MESPHTGTTVIAVSYNGGVVLGSDSRVSMGQYISNRASSKVTPLADNIWLLRSGSAADAQGISDYGEARSRINANSVSLVLADRAMLPKRGASKLLPLLAVRYWSEQHSMDSGRDPSVLAVTNLVKQVMACHQFN